MDQQDTLMKYLYKGMGAKGLADANGSVLLSWHEKVRNILSVQYVMLILRNVQLFSSPRLQVSDV